MPKDPGPNKPPEAEDPGLEKLKQAAMDTYARQAAQQKKDLEEQARSDEAIAKIRAEAAGATGAEAGPKATAVTPAPAPVPETAAGRVVLPRATGQKLPSHSPKPPKKG